MLGRQRQLRVGGRGTSGGNEYRAEYSAAELALAHATRDANDTPPDSAPSYSRTRTTRGLPSMTCSASVATGRQRWNPLLARCQPRGSSIRQQRGIGPAEAVIRGGKHQLSRMRTRPGSKMSNSWFKSIRGAVSRKAARRAPILAGREVIWSIDDEDSGVFGWWIIPDVSNSITRHNRHLMGLGVRSNGFVVRTAKSDVANVRGLVAT